MTAGNRMRNNLGRRFKLPTPAIFTIVPTCMNAEAKQIIALLELAPLPQEGGFFRRTWVSQERLAGGRAASSAILFLITPGNFSALHRVRAEELWCFHSGDAVEHVQLDPRDRSIRQTLLGADALKNQAPQVVVPGTVWQGARLDASRLSRGWALFSCSLTPGWTEASFELGERPALTETFPAHAAWIAALTR